jgi:hypothetical protein
MEGKSKPTVFDSGRLAGVKGLRQRWTTGPEPQLNLSSASHHRGDRCPIGLPALRLDWEANGFHLPAKSSSALRIRIGQPWKDYDRRCSWSGLRPSRGLRRVSVGRHVYDRWLIPGGGVSICRECSGHRIFRRCREPRGDRVVPVSSGW